MPVFTFHVDSKILLGWQESLHWRSECRNAHCDSTEDNGTRGKACAVPLCQIQRECMPEWVRAAPRSTGVWEGQGGG